MRRLLVALGTLSLAVTFVGLAPPVSSAAPAAHTYGYHAQQGDWALAVADARSHGWKIVSITSAEEQAAVAAQMPDTGYYWIGATDARREGTWKWATGGPAFWLGTSSGSTVHGSYANWYTNEPNDQALAPGEDCVVMRGDGYWNDISCDNAVVAGYLYEH